MSKRAKLPIGYENFEEIRRNGFYYVDKTALIKDILEGGSEIVSLSAQKGSANL